MISRELVAEAQELWSKMRVEEDSYVPFNVTHAFDLLILNELRVIRTLLESA